MLKRLARDNILRESHRFRIIYVERIEGLPRDVNLGLEFDSVLEVWISGEYGSCMPGISTSGMIVMKRSFSVIHEIL